MRSRLSLLIPTALILGLCFILFGAYSQWTLTNPPIQSHTHKKKTILLIPRLSGPNTSDTFRSIHNQYETTKSKLGGSSDKALSTVKDLFSADEQRALNKKPRYAITSSVQTASFTAFALMLGYSIQKHNDLAAMGAEMVLLIREDGADAVTKENRTRLEAAGWKVKVAQDLEFEGVDNSKIRAHHRHNLNKLNLWSWTEYEKILFIDADVVCKGSLKELWEMPGGLSAVVIMGSGGTDRLPKL